MVQVIQQPKTQSWKDDRSKKASDALKAMENQSKEQEASKLAANAGLPYVDLNIFSVDPKNLTLIAEEDARRLQIAIFDKAGPKTRIAFVNPINPEADDFLAPIAAERDWTIEKYVASITSLEKAWGQYKDAPLLENLDLWRVSLHGDDLKQFEENFGELLKLKDSANVPVSKTVEVILAGAEKLRASDIHIEPQETGARLRYRIDGLLQEIGILPESVYRLTLSRVKMLSHMKINIRDRAQDGHFNIDLLGKKVDLRVNVIPGNHGENINLRILNSDDVLLDVEKLGITGETYEKIMEATNRPHGMIINTGPTGSGKTTTLYSLLNQLNKPDVKIITVEDPIEYQIPGIVQTEVSKNGEYSFGSALRAIVRQDPDIVLVGEIRDEETADIAINAALTGHLLLSTIHANSAPGAIPRFIEMGMRPSLIASAINIIIGQRLVRKLCSECKESYIPAKETIDSLKRLLSVVSPKAKIHIPEHIETLWKPVGCAQCNLTGYKGRIGIFEVFTFSKKIEDLILELGTEKEIMAAALEEGMITMLQDGILKALKGITTMEEVWHATGQQEFIESLYTKTNPEQASSAPSTEETKTV